MLINFKGRQRSNKCPSNGLEKDYWKLNMDNYCRNPKHISEKKVKTKFSFEMHNLYLSKK